MPSGSTSATAGPVLGGDAHRRHRRAGEGVERQRDVAHPGRAVEPRLDPLSLRTAERGGAPRGVDGVVERRPRVLLGPHRPEDVGIARGAGGDDLGRTVVRGHRPRRGHGVVDVVVGLAVDPVGLRRGHHPRPGVVHPPEAALHASQAVGDHVGALVVRRPARPPGPRRPGPRHAGRGPPPGRRRRPAVLPVLHLDPRLGVVAELVDLDGGVRRRRWCRRRRRGAAPGTLATTAARRGRGRVRRPSSVSRSLRTTTWVTPSASRAAGRWRCGRGSATACSTESSSRRVPAGATVTWARAIHGGGSSTWMGSSMVRPHVCTAKPAPGSTSACRARLVVEVGHRFTPLLGTSSKPPVGAQRAHRPPGPRQPAPARGHACRRHPRDRAPTGSRADPAPAGARPSVTQAADAQAQREPHDAGRTCGCCAGARGRCRGHAATRRRQHRPAQPPLPAVSTARPTRTRRHQHPAFPQPLLQQPDEPDRGDQDGREEQ